MPRVEKVSGGQHDLRVTRRGWRKISKNRWRSPSLRVKCGCCNEAVVIFHDEHLVDLEKNTLEINGVSGSIAQWRQVLLPKLGLQPVPAVGDCVKEGFKYHWESVV